MQRVPGAEHMAFREFLVKAQTALLKKVPLEVVIGNEAADADSCISALVYGFALQHRTQSSRHLVPVISCPRVDFALRREAVYMLEQCFSQSPPSQSPHGSKSWLDSLVFLDDLTSNLEHLRSMHDKGELSIVLVDHNELTGALSSAGLGSCVREILDHHADQGAHPDVTGALRHISFDPTVRKGVGSTCTLVAEALAGSSLLTPDIARLLLGVILLDTSCLSAHAGKATAQDHAAVAALNEVIRKGTGNACNIEALYETLSNLRDDPEWWASLTPQQALAYDYKGFEHKVGPSSSSATTGGCSSGSGAVVRYGTGVLAMHATKFMRRPPADLTSKAGVDPALLAPEEKVKKHLRPHASTLEACIAFAKQRGVDFLVVLSRAKGKRKGVFIYTAPEGSAFTEGHFALMIQRLAAVKEIDAKVLTIAQPVTSASALTSASSSVLRTMCALKFGNHRISRKQVVPILDEILQQVMAS